MELKMNDYLLPEKILFNYEELKQELVEKIAHYETLVYTDEQIKDAKADKTTLNKLKKALNEERIRVKNEYLKPFEDFEKKINEIISIIDEPVTAIDKQIKQYEEKNRQEKLEKVKELWQSLDAPEGLTFEKVFQEKFLNVSCSTKRVSQYMIDAIDKFNREIETLEQLPAFSFEAQQVYKETCDINKALLEGQKLLKIQKEKEDLSEKNAKRDKRGKYFASNYRSSFCIRRNKYRNRNRWKNVGFFLCIVIHRGGTCIKRFLQRTKYRIWARSQWQRIIFDK